MRSLKVLILEDNPFQLMALHQMLNANQVFDVLTADSVDAAKRALCNRGSVDIAICDLQMDGPDGLEFIRYLAQTRQARGLLVLSSAADSVIEAVGRLAQSQGLEVLGCLQKPLSASVLGDLLAKGLWHTRQEDEPDQSQPWLPLTREQLLTTDAGSQPDLAALTEQWTVHYQPKVNLGGDVVGVEALVRWQHPLLGLLAPGRFMSIVERHGLIEPLTWRVLDQALTFSATMMQRHGEPMPVAVNIAPQMLELPGFAEQVLVRLVEHELPASVLTLEIVEQAAADPGHLQLEELLRLRLQGCKVSIDDFGTGASNIQRLLQMPFSELKIPAEFVRGMGDDPRKAAVVAGAMLMARRLALDVVVEGVETLDDFHSVMTLDAPTLQGYFIARPMSEENLTRWLAERVPDAGRPVLRHTLAQDNPCSCR
ncbi:EAL domain-containing protein [Pseudomonas sp. v388]|uniref:EAL domain-containing response regulator n=1 Tax=Pseudomonas sp. v388 TaxID=2479849 RepID=UPI000F77C2EC|nr:EAL domain-containing response regulator [Pseudomonas sp. v388]RRV08219.1 EAL domain-containing protein [Pseudomonas sp. v388]